MHRIDTVGNVAGTFTDTNPATIVDDDWLNAVQSEIVNLIEAAGITLVKGTNTQVAAAVAAYIATHVAATPPHPDQVPWTLISPITGTLPAADLDKPAYRVDARGRVYLRGFFTPTTTGFASLPGAVAPARTRRFAVHIGGDAGAGGTYLTIGANVGGFAAMFVAAANQQYYLDGISWDVGG